MTVRRLRRELTDAELAQWYAFYQYKEHKAKTRTGGRRGGS